MDVKRQGDVIIVSMKDYAKSLVKLEIRKGQPNDKLTEVEMKVYRKYIGNLLWLAGKTRSDLAI